MEAREGEVRDWSTGEGMPEQALAAFRKAQAALQNMDFTEFGEAWQELGEILEGLNRE
jgi:flagellin-specific chaperone FliS